MGKGRFIIGNDIAQLLTEAKVARETMTDLGLSYTRRADGDNYTYFVANRGKEAFAGWVPVSVKASSVTIFNPMTAQAGIAKVKTESGQTSLYLQLKAGESYVLQTSNQIIKGATYPNYHPLPKQCPLVQNGLSVL